MRGMMLVLTLVLCLSFAAPAETIDLSKAVITHGGAVPELTARFLSEEIAQRTGIALKLVAAPKAGEAVIALDIDVSGGAWKPEGYAITVDAAAKRVLVRGADARGVLFGAGRLIRLLELRPDAIGLAGDTAIESAPRYPIRAHQLGFRPTANTYDAWNLKTYEQYIRDLALFGTNGIELIPSTAEDISGSPVMPRNPRDMNRDLSELIGSYGLDVWIWLAVREDLSKPEEADLSLKRWREELGAMKHVDGIFVPGGDGGNNPIRALLPWLQPFAAMLKEIHPEATVWISHQTLEPEELDYFFDYLTKEQPQWLTGVVFGPWTHIGIEETRQRTPQQYRLRRYPDVNHNVRCEFPVPDWDPAFAQTLGREAVCPRPREMAHIHNMHAALSDGFGSYSDGSHDDLNKIVWSALAWDPEMPVEQIVREYSEVFFGEDLAARGEEGLFGLEQNWVGPVEANANIAQVLEVWRGLEDAVANPKTNWRAQMYLLRALYDRYVQARYAIEQQQQAAALAVLSGADAAAAIKEARAILAEGGSDETKALRDELQSLGRRLFKSIGFQLSIKPPYHASNSERGAVLDYLDQPLNERRWMEAEFKKIEKETDPARQQAMLHDIVTWEQPGEGSFYDDLGNLRLQAHLARQKSIEDDPSGFLSPRIDFGSMINNTTLELSDQRLSWLSWAETLYATPLQMHYDALDPAAQYRLRITYTGRYRPTMSLKADGQFEIHGALPQPPTGERLEFDVPKEATADGVLDLEWTRHAGRGCQVSEVWLLRVVP